LLKWLDQEQNQYIRDLTKMGNHTWRKEQLSPIERHLLNIGILVIVDECTLRFTSSIILRVCIDTLWPRPKNRLLRNEVIDPLALLTDDLQYISSATFTDKQVQNKFGPAEMNSQAALYSIFNDCYQ